MQSLTLNTSRILNVVKWINDEHIIIGGGGGESKTGVPNGITFLEFDRKNFKLKELNFINTESEVIRDLIVLKDKLICAIANRLVFYKFETIKKLEKKEEKNEKEENKEEEKEEEEEKEKEKEKETETEKEKKLEAKEIEKTIYELKTIHSKDYINTKNEEKIYQESVSYFEQLKLITSIGEENSIGFYNSSSYGEKKILDMGEDNQIFNLDYSKVLGAYVLCCPKKIIFVDQKTFKTIHEISAPKTDRNVRYAYRNVKILNDNSLLLVTLNEFKRKQGTQKGYLVQYRISKNEEKINSKLQKQILIFREPLTDLTIDSKNNQMAIGGARGSLAVYKIKSLSKLFKNASHKLCVTGLSFDPLSEYIASCAGDSSLVVTKIKKKIDFEDYANWIFISFVVLIIAIILRTYFNSLK
ncbi:prolactin regulatory element-binding protein [Anaeramoeba flamelloides]|uniref:Prolactin regulatory element-binding protein n=1 Tax=Anaeramoeba flamelloides TaxID=1746091 RepID=A0AAV8A2X7_9EUKA|nr:prolactin regulatory element-binding protein [Anaeramoeba flamelloides]